jgi:hypothetical protein
MFGALGFAGFESGDCLGGGGARDFGEELVAVEDAEAGVGFVNGDGLAGVADPDVDFWPAMVMLPRLLTRRSTRSASVLGAGGGPPGRVSRRRPRSAG